MATELRGKDLLLAAQAAGYLHKEGSPYGDDIAKHGVLPRHGRIIRPGENIRDGDQRVDYSGAYRSPSVGTGYNFSSGDYIHFRIEPPAHTTTPLAAVTAGLAVLALFATSKSKRPTAARIRVPNYTQPKVPV